MPHSYQLPYANALHSSIHHALKFKLCGENLLSTPRSVVIDGIVSYGGSTGTGVNLPVKAFSEFYERNHLFTQVRKHREGRLNSVKPVAFREKLIKLCRKPTQEEADIDRHEFSLTQVYHLFNDEPQDYFYNAISLRGNKKDQPYLRFTDSCACAAHPVKQEAIYCSLMEFIERQALLASWASKQVRYEINPELLRSLSVYTTLVDNLLENGNLHIYENGIGLPGYTIIMFYFAKSRDDLVQYSIGSSSGLTLKEALNSALVELYQCYSFLYNAECSDGLEDKAGAGYHLKFQQCNHPEIREVIPFLEQQAPKMINTLEELKQYPAVTMKEVLSELKSFSEDFYYYHHYDPGLKLHYTKILNPDYFPHMSLQHVSFDHAFAKSLGLNKENAYLEAIPFP